MLNHISIGVSSIAGAKAFYNAALKPLGSRCLSEDTTSLGYGSEQVVFWVLKSDQPVPDDASSGLHVCFDAPTTASVDHFHAAGLRHGGKDHGKPGPRPDYGPAYYAAFLMDPDGYRIEACCSKTL